MRIQTILTVVLLLSVSTLFALEVQLNVTEDAGQARKSGLVVSGVPFAKGTVKDISRLSVNANGKTVPAQFSLIAPWDDGSVRWALLNTQVDVSANGKSALVLRDDGKNIAPLQGVKIAETANDVIMSTGSFEVRVPKKERGLLRAKLDGKDVFDNSGRGIVLYAPGPAREIEQQQGKKTIKVTVYDPGPQIQADAPNSVVVEEKGPVRAVVAVKGVFPGVHQGLLGYTARITLVAGERQVKVHLWLENNGAMGYYYKNEKRPVPRTAQMEWYMFDGLAVEMGVGLGNANATCEGSTGNNGKFKIFQTCYWNKNNRKQEYNNFNVFTQDDFEYVITSGDEELKRGNRSAGIVEIAGSNGRLTTAIRSFWENYEKAIELEGSQLKLWLWPTEGQWPRDRKRDLQGLYDDELLKLTKPGFYYIPGAVHKGHEFVFDFSGDSAALSSASLSKPLMALANAEYYAGTDAIPGIFAPPGANVGDNEGNEKIAAWENMYASAVDPEAPTGLIQARKQSEWSIVTYFGDTTYWYGWLDFGDIPCPGRGQTSLQNDWLWVITLGAIRSGNVAYMRMASEMAQHRIDVDQFWSDRDLPEVCGLQRGNVNFPAFHCYRLYSIPSPRSNHLAGLVLYYMLTGEPKALEACRRNANGLKVAWKHIAQTKPYGGPQIDMAANSWSIRGYCAMYALTGQREWLDEALALFNTNVVAKWKSLGPHLHERQQIRSQDYAEDDIKYCNSIATLCLLHKYTEDPQVLQLIEEGCATPFPENYYDAPIFLADLFAYGALIKEKPEWAKEAIDQWLAASPESKTPPIFLNGSSTWTKDSAMDLQAGNVLQYYFWKKNAAKK